MEALPGHVFHDDPGVVVLRRKDVVDADEMGVLEVQALADAAQLDVEVLLHQLESHFLAAVGDRQKDLAEAAPAEAAPDRVLLDRLRTGSIGEFHGRSPRVNPARERTGHPTRPGIHDDTSASGDNPLERREEIDAFRPARPRSQTRLPLVGTRRVGRKPWAAKSRWCSASVRSRPPAMTNM